MKDRLQTAEIRKAVCAFLKIADTNVCKTPEEFGQAFMSQGLRTAGGTHFDSRGPVRDAEQEAVGRITKAMGPIHGDSLEVLNGLWRKVGERHRESASGSLEEDTKAALKAIAETATISTRFIAPNFLVHLESGVGSVQVGPVRISTANTLREDLARTHNQLSVAMGPPYGLRMEEGLQLNFAPSMWDVELTAAKPFLDEQAAWLIDIAVSLLRLGADSQPGPWAPAFSDVEADPFVAHDGEDRFLRISEKGFSGAGVTAPRFYLVSPDVASSLKTDKFIEAAKRVFNPGKGSVAARFSQGLGWLSRGRRAVDRATRFLFFFTAVEALLSSSDKTAPVVQTIARHAATLLTDDNSKRLTLAATIKQLYAARSKLVHAGQRDVSKSDAATMSYLAEALYIAVYNRGWLKTHHDRFCEALANSSYGLPFSENEL